MKPNIIETWHNGKTRIYDMSKAADVLRYAIRERFAWPGGYELLVDFPDGSTLCSGCLADRARIELDSVKDADPFERVYLYTAAEIDPDTVYCEHCGKDCSAYSEEE